MVRNISSDGLAKIASKTGTEPIFIVVVDWAGNNAPLSYADRDVVGIPGKILEVGELDNVVDFTGSNSSQEISISLDDTDGSIKSILDNHDVHQRNVWVYQYFAGLDLTDKFLIFQGKLSSPIQWNEGDRTVKFNVISQLEDQEIGFSAEQGQFPFIPKDMVGRAWPIVFGRVFDMPALQVSRAISGKTLCGVGLIGGADLHNAVPLGGNFGSLGASLSHMVIQSQLYSIAASLWLGVDDQRAQDNQDQADALTAQMTSMVDNAENQLACAEAQREAKVAEQGPSCNPIQILGGEDFPQDQTITLNLNGAIFTGTMHNDMFQVSSSVVPTYLQTAAQIAFNQIQQEQCKQQQAPAQNFDMKVQVPPGKGDYGKSREFIRSHGFIFSAGQDSTPSQNQVAQQFWAEAGSSITLASNQSITYIVSIVPGTVLAVKAYKNIHGGAADKPTGATQLVDVPKELYTLSTVNYGTITAVQITMNNALSSVLDQYGVSDGWGDQIYVTFESTIGPNPVDIMKYVIDHWTNGNGASQNLTWDPTSFAYVRTKVDPMPMNFAVMDQKNTIDLLKDIAFQGRCAMWISEGVVYVKFLPEEPNPDDTITLDDTSHQTTSVELTRTEDLVTKMYITWRISLANGNGETPEVMILRNNINQYGTKKAEYDFYCYNQPDSIQKAATFWLIRKSNTWKKISFKTYLNKLNLETFDCVNLQLPGYVASGDVKAVVTRAAYDSVENCISFECETPVKSGTMSQYKFYWPHSLTITDVFPTPEEIANGSAGGGNQVVNGAGGELPIGYTGVIGIAGQPIIWRGEFDPSVAYHVNDAVLYNAQLGGGSYVAKTTTLGNFPSNPTYWILISSSQQQGGTIFVGGPNVLYGPGSDRGDRTPGDVGYLAQNLSPNSVFATVNNSPKPFLNLKLNYCTDITLPIARDAQPSETILDIRTTQVMDSDNPGLKPAFLDNLIGGIKDQEIFLWSDYGVVDGSRNYAEIALKYDEVRKEYAASEAYLLDPDAASTGSSGNGGVSGGGGGGSGHS